MPITVEIEGHSLADFTVRVIDTRGHATEYNITEELKVNDQDLEREIRECASFEHFWHQLAHDADLAHEEFEKIQFAQYSAHTERYARHFLKGGGEKNPTGTAKEQAAVLLYSEGANKEVFAAQAYRGYCDETKQIGLSARSEADFREEMYVFEPSYEEAQMRLLALKHKANQLRAIASAFSTKSWSIKTLAADRRAAMQSSI